MMSQDKFVLEIGIEEIPAQYVKDMANSLKENIEKALVDNLILFDGLQVFHTPRRLVLYISSIATQISEQELDIKGPAKANAYDEHGNITKAFEGFLQGRKLKIEDTYIAAIKGVDYIFAKQKTAAKNTISVLENVLPKLIMSIYQPNPMRWNVFVGKFIRPIRWVLAFLGKTSLNFSLEFLSSSNFTFGHRTLADMPFDVSSVDNYFEQQKKAFVIIDQKERKNLILQQIKKIESDNGIQVSVDDDLLEEIVNLVEYPTVAVGYFDRSFLSLPDPIIITPMKDHQRYFPVYKDGKLINQFVFVRNGDNYCMENVIKGNQRVLTARLKDGEFFYKEDKNTTLMDKSKKLVNVIFQTKLGNYVEKMKRVSKIANYLAKELKLNLSENINTITPIFKADLVSAVVGEFSELQGIMGGIYAREEGYSEEISCAIEDQYRPCFANDMLPKSEFGAVMAISDKLDTILGLCAVNLRPTGSQDPFALRRLTIGVLSIIRKFNFDLTLSDVVSQLADLYHDFYTMEKTTKEEFVNYVISFSKQRLSIMLAEDLKYSITDVINRIDLSSINVVTIEKKASTITSLLSTEQFQTFTQTLQRIDNLISKEERQQTFNATLIENPDEQAVFDAYNKVKDLAKNHLKESDYISFVNVMYGCCKLVNVFFDNNMILSKDNNEEHRNRVYLLGDISSLMHQFIV